jgi:hypothetical protein
MSTCIAPTALVPFAAIVYHGAMLRARLNRAGCLLAAVFQLVLPTFVSAADARAEAMSARRATVVHVEAFGSTTCPRLHPADCMFCRYLATGARAASATTVVVPVARVIETGPAGAEHQRSFARAPGDPPQRAPPV